MNRNCRFGLWVALPLVLAIAFSKTLVHLLTEVWWFDAIDFASVFWTRLTWQVLVWGVSLVAYGAVVWGNYRLAMHNSHAYGWMLLDTHDLTVTTKAKQVSNWVAAIVIGLIALTAATASLPAWETVLKYFHPTALQRQDPIFHQDVGFYLFRLPLYEGLHLWLVGLVLSAIAFAASVYLLKGMIASSQRYAIDMIDDAKPHLSFLLGILFFLIAWGFWLGRYHLLYSAGDVVFGASYTDVHARLVAYLVLGAIALGVGVLFFLSMNHHSFSLPLRGLGLFLAAFIVLNGLYPWFMQQFIVNPNELLKEKPYIEHNIQFTQAAYRLDTVNSEPYGAIAPLTRQSLQTNQETVRNIRLWDYHPLLSTFKQLQEIRLYYKFTDVDIDRYTLNGEYQQVMLSARELSYAQLPQDAKTWVNQRLKYTHGYGLVMTPVNRIASDGLPDLYIKDIPPVSAVNLPIRQAAIYYGEETHPYIFTGTSTPEFDYPAGTTNAYARYSGTGGVPMPSIWQRLAYAYDLGSIQILISNYFTNQSRIHYYRPIRERVTHIAPFLRFDHDPYLVVIDGRLQWLQDAYTVSDRYPYSQFVAQNQGTVLQGAEPTFGLERINYIRNSVKILIDAYDGSCRFFVVDQTDPILTTYRAIFPHLFEPMAAIPASVKAHFRYPEDLFKIQSQLYLTYHMSDPEVFYNREDLWSVPKQVYESNEVTIEPYYVIMRLPGEEKAGFILIQPFTPARRDNMIAWMAARSNGADYGKLLLYEFPKQSLVYGPRQIEARIDQDPEISQQFTLWNQSGSKVIRGDLLVIPIDQSLLFVEPVYLRSEQSELPELKRVIVAYAQAVAMEDTLEKALDSLFSGAPVEARPPATDAAIGLGRSALDTYRQAQDALRQGDWAAYGRYQTELEQLLQELTDAR